MNTLSAQTVSCCVYNIAILLSITCIATFRTCLTIEANPVSRSSPSTKELHGCTLCYGIHRRPLLHCYKYRKFSIAVETHWSAALFSCVNGTLKSFRAAVNTLRSLCHLGGNQP